jgi:hypothetical protein
MHGHVPGQESIRDCGVVPSDDVDCGVASGKQLQRNNMNDVPHRSMSTVVFTISQMNVSASMLTWYADVIILKVHSLWKSSLLI